ncbi:MAG: sulfite exporter TauE/SafE family protein [Actinomycetota bacterium]|nr:MAG: hypothetical protein FD171_1142 [Actinomycetota bacterium]MDO8949868.1 sulfite exporter TauE/SafE family protein [Actinomycetota bacterium]MDP3629450.1 sulfite exporter TauE/SafE family protein [Actinomycetota bacterium]
MNPSDLGLAIAIGLVSGFLSGQFGIGGGLITTPAIRLVLGQPAMIAVGTPLLVILPTAIAGALAYHRRGLVDTRSGILVGLSGALASVAGAFATRLVGGSTVMIVTAAVICYMAVDMLLLALRGSAARESETTSAISLAPTRGLTLRFVVLGVITGLYSGFLGLGGGFIVVPALVRWFGFDIKKAIGTSLVVVAVLSIPGSITHIALGNVDLRLAGLLALGVIPGALLGAKVTLASGERTVKIAFSALLLVVGVLLALSESGLL